MAKPPASDEQLIELYGPHLNFVPPGGWQDESVHPARKAGEDALLLLRPAVRNSTEGAGKPGDRVRALGGVSVQSGMLCPKGVKRYLQGGHPDRLLNPLMRDDAGFRDADLGRSAGLHGSPAARNSGDSTVQMPLRFMAELRSPRKSPIYWESSRAWRWAPGISTTTAASAWFRRRGLQARRSASTAAPYPGAKSEGGSSVCHWREYRRVCSDYHRLHLALPRNGGQA